MIAQFALQLVLGMSLMWALLPRHQITGGFFRIQMMIAMALGVLAALTAGRLGASTDQGEVIVARVACGAIAVAGYVGAVLWLLNQRTGGAICVFVILASAFIALLATQGGVADMTAARGFVLASQVSTAAVLGGAVSGMLLGHWYLTAPTMSISPLQRASILWGVAVVVRLVLSAAGWSLSGGMLTDGTHWTWFTLRWLAGIVGPLVIAVMAVQILKFRNTQAATGVLFAGVILSFIGELSAALLYSELHVAL